MSDERDGIVHGTAGGPYCGGCGAPAEREEVDTTDLGGTASTLYGDWSCPNGCVSDADSSSRTTP